MKKLTTEEFIQKSMVIHGDLYDYSLTDYKTATINVIIICRVHGKFEKQPHKHLNGSGCTTCSHIISAQKKALNNIGEYRHAHN